MYGKCKSRLAFPTTTTRSHDNTTTYASTTTSILHMYNGNVKLSFCSDSASNTDDNTVTTPYRPI